MRWIYGTIFLLVLTCIGGICLWPRSVSPYLYRLAVCSMFKNEAPWLKEWLVYHHEVLGVEHFYLYDNDSQDHYEEVLRPFMEKGIVELIPWDSREEHALPNPCPGQADFVRYQLGAFNDCLGKRALGKARWVAVIDIDEFIVPVHGVASLYKALKREEKENRGSWRLKWRVFGTSHIATLGEKELLTDKMRLRCEEESSWHILTKAIHRPEAISFCLVHEAAGFNPGFKGRTANPSKFRIHHYWARTENFCQGYRGHRGYEEQNRLEDDTMAQYLPALKGAMERW